MSTGEPAPSPGFARTAAATSVAHAALFALSLLTAVLVARVLGPEGKGAYTLVLLFASIFVFFSTLGVHQAAAFYLGRRAYPAPLIFGHTMLYLAVLGALAVAAAAVALGLLGPALFPGVPRRWLGLGLPLVAGQLAFGFLALMLLGLQRIASYNVVQVLRGGVMVLLAAPLLLTGYGVAGVLVAELASYLVIAVLAFTLVFRQIRGLSLRYNAHYVRASLRYGLTVYSGTALGFFHYRIDLVLLSVLTNPAVVGLYSIAAGLAGNLSLLSAGAATALFPRVSSDPDPARINTLTPLVLRTILAVCGGAALVLAVAGPWLIVAIFGAAFAGATRAFQVLLPGAVALCAWSILDGYFKGSGRPAWSTLTTGLAVVGGAALNLWWIPRYGLLGASAASSVASLVAFGVALVTYARLCGAGIAAILLPRRTDFSLYRELLSRLLRSRSGAARVIPPAAT